MLYEINMESTLLIIIYIGYLRLDHVMLLRAYGDIVKECGPVSYWRFHH